MRVETDEEEERKMVGIPEGLETLMADFVVGSGVHQQHDVQQEMTRDTASLSVVDIQCLFRSNLFIPS